MWGYTGILMSENGETDTGSGLSIDVIKAMAGSAVRRIRALGPGNSDDEDAADQFPGEFETASASQKDTEESAESVPSADSTGQTDDQSTDDQSTDDVANAEGSTEAPGDAGTDLRSTDSPPEDPEPGSVKKRVAPLAGLLNSLRSLSIPSPRVFRENLLAKMFAGLFVILLFAGGTAGFFYLDMDSQLDDQVDTQIRETANLQSDIYTAWFEDREDELESIGSDARLTTDDRGIQSGFLDSQLEQSEFETLHIVSLDSGEVLASSTEEAMGQSMHDRVDEELISATQFVTGQQYTSFGDETVVGMGDPLATREDEILIGEINATSGGPEVRQTTEDSRTIVVNEAGNPVLGQEGVGEGIVDVDAEETTVTSQGDWIYATATLDNGLFMVTQTPSEEAFALSESILQSFLVTLLVTFAVMSVVIGFGGRSIQKSITTLAARARAMEEGDLSVDLSTDREDEIGTLYGSFDGMRDALRERIAEAEKALEDAESARSQAEDARQEAESAREQAQQVNEQIESSASEYSEVMEAAADGDLTVRMKPNEENEAMTAIANDFNEMIAEFELVVDEVKQFASEVSTASDEVTASSGEVSTASEQVSEAIQDISASAVEQNESLQEVNAEMNDLSATVQEIAASSDEVADVAARTAETGREGREAANDAIEGMEMVREESQEAVDEIQELESQVEQVDELIARISDIAEQTSILALNANIEAARAGGDTDGAGFSVVAQEVKKLSEDAKQAAEEIENRLSSIRTQTERSAQAVQETSEGIEEHTSSVENAAQALAEVAENADKTNSGIQDISTATDEQAETTDQVVYMIDEAARIAQETTQDAETTTATAEEQTAAMAEVSKSASELSTQANQLSQALDRFVTDGSASHDQSTD